MDWWQVIIAAALGLGLGWLMMRNQGVDFSNISVLKRNDFVKNMRKGQLVDIRKKTDFEQDKIKGARNFKVSEITSKQPKIRRDQPVYLYCQNGKKSRRTARKMMRKFYKQVYVLEGGLNAYNEAN